MAFQPVPKTVSVTIRHVGKGDLAGSRAQWTLYVVNTGGTEPASDGELSAINAAFDTWVDSEYLDLLSSSWNVQDQVVKDLSVVGGETRIGSQNEDGLRSGDPLPANVAAWVKLLGVGGNLPTDGGVFWPVGVEADTDGNDWVSTFVASCDAAMSELKGAIEAIGGTYHLVLVSRSQVEGNAVRNARIALRNAINASRRETAVTNQVSSFATRALVASQRDRRPS